MEGGSPAADFAYGDDDDEPDFAATYRAGYPYGAWSSDLSTVTLPAFQNFVEGGMAGFPMYVRHYAAAPRPFNPCASERKKSTTSQVRMVQLPEFSPKISCNSK